jgi:hypothetical protein
MGGNYNRLGVCVGELDAVELKCTRWNGYPCSDPIVGRTGEVCTRKARFAAREFENTLEVVEVVGVGNRESIFDFACKCRYEAKIPVPARFLTVDLSHSGFSSMKSLQVLVLVLSYSLPNSRSRSVLIQASRSRSARSQSRLPSNANWRSENDPSESSETYPGPHSLYRGVLSRCRLLIRHPSPVLELELEGDRRL